MASMYLIIYINVRGIFMKEIVAIGPREQDFSHTGDFFKGSVTLYGSGLDGNVSYCNSKKVRINHNVFNIDQDSFVNKELEKWIENNPNIKFMSYDPNQAFLCGEDVIKRTLCLNNKSLMNKLNNKSTFRKWAKPLCEVQNSLILVGKQCTYENLTGIFSGYDSFVVQLERSSGGEGTFIIDSKNREIVESRINETERYMVSGYEKFNIPINAHAIIYKDDILIFPTSIQIMRLNGCQLLYQGADYIAAQTISSKMLLQFKKYMINICQQLQKEGYLGVTGVDAMIVGESVKILEMNNRFQGSTILLNMALEDAGLPSMHELNYEAFERDRASCSIEEINVPYSCFTYIADEFGNRPRGHYQKFHNEPHVVEVMDEGLDYNWQIAPFATLERVVFDTNIVSVIFDNRVAVHPNIIDTTDKWVHEISEKKNLINLKIALINQGVYIPPETNEFFKKNGGMREAVYNAVDLYFDKIVINTPISVKFTALSPFNLKIENNSIALYFFNHFISTVEIRETDKVRELKTSSGQLIKDICLLATDRVRIQHSCNCNYVRHNAGCKFCEVENHEFSFNFKDICEAIDMYKMSKYNFRHFLIGGRSDSVDKEIAEITAISNYINKDTKWPIYVMCVPPIKKESLDSFFKAGVTEIAFNIEIWDRSIARSWMPGKGAISLNQYLEALKYAVKLWGDKGAVRSSFVVGLEPVNSLLEGIKAVCEIGVAPILSVFRPIPGTFGENFVPLNNNDLLYIYKRAKDICNLYNLALGPQCISCQNNTLSLPHEFECEEG